MNIYEVTLSHPKGTAKKIPYLIAATTAAKAITKARKAWPKKNGFTVSPKANCIISNR